MKFGFYVNFEDFWLFIQIPLSLGLYSSIFTIFKNIWLIKWHLLYNFAMPRLNFMQRWQNVNVLCEYYYFDILIRIFVVFLDTWH